MKVEGYKSRGFLTPQFLILISLSLFLIVNNIIWLRIDTLPPAWDQAGHLLSSYKYFHAIEKLDSHLFHDLLNISNFYPPLFYISSYPFYKVFGMSSDLGCLTNSIFLIILIFSTYGIANNLYGGFTGILSAFMVSTYHVVFTHSREYLLEISLVSIAALSVYLLLKSDDFKIRRYSIAFGVASGIGMLTRWNFAFFLFPVVMYKLYRILTPPFYNRGSGGISGLNLQIKNILIALSLSIIIFSPWYITNIGRILLRASFSLHDVAIMEGDPHGVNLENFLFYIRSLNEQILSPQWLLFIIGFAIYIYRYISSKFKIPNSQLQTHNSELLFWWFAGSYMIITTITNKDTLRFSMPYLPAVAIFSIFWIKDVHHTLFKKGLIIFLIIISTVQFFSSTYGLKIFPWERVTIGSMNIIFSNVNRPIKEDWKIEEIEKVILAEGSFFNIKNRVRIIPDHPRFTRVTFEYYKYIHGYDTIEFSQHSNFPSFTDYIITKTGYQGPPFSKKAYSLAEYIEGAPPVFTSLFQKVKEIELPDGSVASLYKREIAPTQGVYAQDVVNMIKERLERLILQFIKEYEGLEIKLTPYNDKETSTGRFKEITVFARKAVVGDYSHKDRGVIIHDVRFTFYDITLNLHTLKDGKVEVISLKEVIPSGKIFVKDLREYIVKEIKGKRDIHIFFEKEGISISSGLNSYLGLTMKFMPVITHENNIGIEVKKLNISVLPRSLQASLPIPSIIVNIPLQNIYIFRQDQTPCRVVLNNITIGDGYLRIN
ncbi:MAG: glycosyltransferase family 39 protein [Nitrospinota bacterium]|mgnify:CR=1 FL=1